MSHFLNQKIEIAKMDDFELFVNVEKSIWRQIQNKNWDFFSRENLTIIN